MWTASPPSSSRRTSTSPVCTPARICRPIPGHCSSQGKGAADSARRDGRRSQRSRPRWSRPHDPQSEQAHHGSGHDADRACLAIAGRPTSAARSVEPTMSVKRSVVSSDPDRPPLRDPGEKLLDFVEQDVDSLADKPMIGPGELDELSPPLSPPPPDGIAPRDNPILGSIEYQCRTPDRRQEVANIGLQALAVEMGNRRQVESTSVVSVPVGDRRSRRRSDLAPGIRHHFDRLGHWPR